MEIYVQSCGISQEQGYCWLQIAKDIQQRVDEPILVRKFKYLLQTEVPSILLLKESEKLLLLVTGIKASKRTDYQGRIIQNSVAWVDEDSDENEKQLRALAIRALRSFVEKDSLTKEIDDAIKISNEEGFKVDNFEDIKAEKLTKNLTVGNTDIDSNNKKIGNNSENLAKKLAEELEEYCLPKQKDQEPIIVVFTGIKKPSTLEQAGVWRGLSSLVQEQEWKDYEKSQTEQKNNTLIFIVIFIILIILYLLLSQPQPKLNQETQLLPQPASLSTQPASSPSPPNQLLENNLNPTPILPKIQDPSSKSQALETVNTSNSGSQPEATKESILKGKTCEPVKQQILTDGKVDSQLRQKPIEKTFPTKLVEPTKNSSNCSEKNVEPNL